MKNIRNGCILKLGSSKREDDSANEFSLYLYNLKNEIEKYGKKCNKQIIT